MPKKIITYCLALLLLSGCIPQTTTIQAIMETAVPSSEIGTPISTPLSPVHTDTETSLPPTITQTATRIEATPTVSVTSEPTETGMTISTITADAGAQTIVDHTSVELFEQIPDKYLEAAQNLHMMWADRSVGQNINEALDCLTAQSWSSSPAHCRRDYYSTDDSTWEWKTYTNSTQAPTQILFNPNPEKYNRSNWIFEIQGGEWENLIQDFVVRLVPAYVQDSDVLSFQITYLNVERGSDIDDPTTGMFVDQPHDGFYKNRERWDISDLEELEKQYPDKIFIYWTTSLARGIGSPDSTVFNDQIRQYALTQHKILFDVADILSHKENGDPCYDNRDGIEYCGRNGCENNADDNEDYPAICQEYTTELEGGHLGSVSGGKIRVAKAFWVLMAQIAGWNGKDK